VCCGRVSAWFWNWKNSYSCWDSDPNVSNEVRLYLVCYVRYYLLQYVSRIRYDSCPSMRFPNRRVLQSQHKGFSKSHFTPNTNSVSNELCNYSDVWNITKAPSARATWRLKSKKNYLNPELLQF